VDSEPHRLSPADRDRVLSRAGSGHFDAVVVGGGITGSGCALDAAARGLSVLLVEAGDLAGGTSSRSGKTAHGGLRYLEQLNFSLVAEALRERDLMIGVTAPHLVAAEPFLLPTTRWWERPYFGAGVLSYDAMASARRRGAGVPAHRHLSRRGTLALAPGLDASVVTGGIRYHDGRMDDARHTLAVARTAAGHGALVLSHARVTGMRVEGGRVRAVAVRTAEGGELEVSAGSVVNAAGVWAADVQAMAGEPAFAVRPAKGVHLLVESGAFDSRTGLIARAEDSVVILRRWYGRWLLGTTDTAYEGDRSAPGVDAEDVDYLLRNVNRYLARPLTRADVLGAHAGLRPLLAAGDTATTSALSRDHAVLSGHGMVTVVGGKYTTYRLMARDAVDAVGRVLGRRLPPTPTARIPLVGARDRQGAAGRAASPAAGHGVAEHHVRRMLLRYGDETPRVLETVRRDPALGETVAGYLAAELRYAVTHEGARTLEDVLARRTRVALEAPDGGAALAPRAAALVAPPLGWGDADVEREVAAYRAAVVRDRAALG
jgi:glycerol-3-phosphate dehydrogenase